MKELGTADSQCNTQALSRHTRRRSGAGPQHVHASQMSPQAVDSGCTILFINI